MPRAAPLSAGSATVVTLALNQDKSWCESTAGSQFPWNVNGTSEPGSFAKGSVPFSGMECKPSAFRQFGPVAQGAERALYKRGVVGASPTGTMFSPCITI